MIKHLQKNYSSFAWDGCHKIYIIENDEDDAVMRALDYDIYLIKNLDEAWDSSCSLRFISSVDFSKSFIDQSGKVMDEKENEAKAEADYQRNLDILTN